LFVMLNVNVWPSGSEAVGVKLYAWPTFTDDGGVPPMTGARFAAGVTAMEKAARETFAVPSDAAIVMAEWVPVADGMPLSLPVVVLKVAQAGLFVMLNVSV
jgi:hypothetical protein